MSTVAEQLKTITAEQAQALAAAKKVKPEGFDVDAFDPKTVDRVWEQVVQKNDPPSLFRRLGRIVIPVAEGITTNLVRIFARQLKVRLQQERDDDNAQFIEVGVELFREIVSRLVRFYDRVGRGNKQKEVDTYARQQLIKQMMASPVCPLPLARGLVRTPSFDRRGALIHEPGYHQPSGIFYAPHPGFKLPDIHTKPTKEDVQRALGLWRELVDDFPFVDDAGRAHTLALPLTVIAREMIQGPVPMWLVSKPASGTGGTLLLQCVGWIVLGEDLPESTWSADEEEQRKFLTSALLQGRPLINLDNLTHLYSKDLLAVLSGTKRGDRLLGGNEMLSIQNRAAFCGSGNNVSFNEEHAGRLYVTRLDAKVPNPRLRDQTFRHDDLMGWTKENRPPLVAALLTIIQAWIAADRPKFTGKRLAGFEAWSNVVGGILEHAEVQGFLANRDAVLNTAQGSEDEDLEFVTAWFVLLRDDKIDKVVKTKELLQKLMHVAPRPRGGGEATERSLGHYLGIQVDKIRVLEDGTEVAIRRKMEDKHAKIQRWSLEVVHEKDAEAPPVQTSMLEKTDDVIPF